MHGAVCKMVVTSSMCPLSAESLPPDGDLSPLDICLAPMRMISKAATNRIGDIEQPMAILTSNCCHPVIRPLREKHICGCQNT